MANRGPEGWKLDGALPPSAPGAQARELGRDANLQAALAAVPEAGIEGSLVGTELGSFSRAALLHLPNTGAEHVKPNPQFAADPSTFVFEDTDPLPQAPGRDRRQAQPLPL